MESIYAGFPEALASPRIAAARIVELGTREERERFFSGIPERWRPQIVHFACVGLAADVVIAISLEQRQRRLAEVPPEWRADVEAHAKRLWPRRDELRDGSWRPGRKPEETPA